MHRLVVASLAAAGLSIGITVAASAADLGRPAPAPVYTKAPPVAAPYSWSGFYVGGNGGVYRSVDFGGHWTFFPSVADGANQDGGMLANAIITSLSLQTGNVNPANLNCMPLALGTDTYGKPPTTGCSYAMYVKDGKFALLKPKGGSKPYWTVKLIGKSVTENATTTTAAPQ